SSCRPSACRRRRSFRNTTDTGWLAVALPACGAGIRLPVMSSAADVSLNAGLHPRRAPVTLRAPAPDRLRVSCAVIRFSLLSNVLNKKADHAAREPACEIRFGQVGLAQVRARTLD